MAKRLTIKELLEKINDEASLSRYLGMSFSALYKYRNGLAEPHPLMADALHRGLEEYWLKKKKDPEFKFPGT